MLHQALMTVPPCPQLTHATSHRLMERLRAVLDDPEVEDVRAKAAKVRYAAKTRPRHLGHTGFPSLSGRD